MRGMFLIVVPRRVSIMRVPDLSYLLSCKWCCNLQRKTSGS
jgi:hypothetical protein